MRQQKEFTTNKTLIFLNGTTKPHYFLATYVRTRVLSISKIDYRQMAAKLNCQIFIDISTKDTKIKDIKKVLQQGIRLSFEANESMLINSENKDVTIHHHEHSQRITLIIHKFIQVKLITRSKYELVWAPFQLIVCKLALRINKIRIVHDQEPGRLTMNGQVDPVQSEYHFNIMDHPDMNMKLTISSNSKFGLFKIANNKFHVEYRNGFLDKAQIEKIESKSSKKVQRKIRKLRGDIASKGENQISKKILRYYQNELDDDFTRQIEQEAKNRIPDEIEKRLQKKFSNNPGNKNRIEAQRKVLQNDENFHRLFIKQQSEKIRNEQGDTLIDKLIVRKDRSLRERIERQEHELQGLLNKPQQIKPFDVAIFEIPIYKIPLVPTLTIALPIFFLAIINLGVFYQTPDLKDRIVSVSLLLVSFVALIPTIREQIPPTPVYTILEVIVFAESLTTVLALIQSIDVNEPFDQNGPPYNFEGNNAYFIVSIIITAISMIIVAMMSLAYAFFWRKQYLRVDDLGQMILDQPIKNYEWRNSECDNYFKPIFSHESQLSRNSESSFLPFR